MSWRLSQRFGNGCVGRTKETVITFLAVAFAIVTGLGVVKNLGSSVWDPGSSSTEQSGVGRRLAVGFDFSATPETAVVALEQGCGPCIASMPFYRRLSAELAKKGLPLLALFPRNAEQGDFYLQSNGVGFAAVRQAVFGNAGIEGTPTLMIVDRRGVIRRVWLGLLTRRQEREVLNSFAKM
jgi:thiol-disulfide isomerase/thioredoxin